MSEENIIHATPKAQKPQHEPAGLSQSEVRQIGTLSAEDTKLIRARQDARSRVLGLLLVGMCILFFAITIVKIGIW